MTTSLSALTSLECLFLSVDLEGRRPPSPPSTRSILPNLTTILFLTFSGYEEEILARIDAPRLNRIQITFTPDGFIFDSPQLFQLIKRTTMLRAPEKGQIIFHSNCIIIRFQSQTSDLKDLSVEVASMRSELRQFSSLVQVCTSSLPPVSTLEDLYILNNSNPRLHLLDDVENMVWLQLLHRFATVKNLYLSKKFVSHIASALEELVGARTTEVLPALENIFLEGLQPSGPLHEGIETFVTARRLTSHPVAVSRWDKDSE